MRTSLGISAGNEVVCSALVATGPSGEQHFDYRVVSADAAHSDLGDLVSSSIELMTTQLPVSETADLIGEPLGRYSTGAHRRAESTRTRPPTSVAVAYRNKEQAQAIRAATTRRRDLRLVPEGTAALSYLRETGLLDRYATVAVVDLGATGLTVTVADYQDGSVLHSERTPTLSGNAIDELIYHHLVDLHYARRGARPNRATLTNRGRAAKEHLSIAPAVTIDHVAGQPLKLTRSDFEELIGGLLRNIALFSTSVFSRAPKYPEAVAVIGGCANIPAVLDTLAARLDMPVLTVPDPEAVIAKGAALVADAAAPSALPSALQAASLTDVPSGTVTKVVGTLAGAVVVVGLVIGYGVQAITPDPADVTPAGTSSTVRQPSLSVVPAPAPTPQNHESADRTSVTLVPPVTEVPAPTAAPTTTAPAPTTAPPSPGSPSSTAPSLRPDPNLPQIPYPDSPLGPIDSGSGGRDQRPSTPNTSPAQAPAHGVLPITPEATPDPQAPARGVPSITPDTTSDPQSPAGIPSITPEVTSDPQGPARGVPLITPEFTPDRRTPAHGTLPIPEVLPEEPLILQTVG